MNVLLVFFGIISLLIAGFDTSRAAASMVLAVGATGFWIFLSGWSFFLLFAMDSEDEEDAAFWSLLLAGFVFQIFSGVNIVGEVWNNPQSVIAVIVCYLLLGVCWSFFKWFIYCRDERRLFDSRKTAGSKAAPERPMAVRNKSRITAWMTFWPWSALWFIINDPVRRFFRWTFDTLESTYQKISDRAWEGTE